MSAPSLPFAGTKTGRESSIGREVPRAKPTRWWRLPMAWQHARIYYLVAHLRWVVLRLSRTLASVFKALCLNVFELEDTATAEV